MKPRKRTKSAKGAVMRTEYKMKVVGAKKGRGSYRRKPKHGGYDG